MLQTLAIDGARHVLTVSLVSLGFSETSKMKNLDYNSVIEQFILMECLAAVPI